MRKQRPLYAAAGTLMLAVPASAVALTAGHTDTPSALSLDTSARHAAYGRDVTIRGTAAPATSGARLLLEFAPSGSTSWRTLGSTTVGGDGHFRFVTRLRRSGLLRVVDDAVSPTHGTLLSGSAATPAVAPSAPQPIAVSSAFRLRHRSIDLLGGGAVELRGKLLPGIAGRRVILEARSGRRWRQLASARTGARGGFRLRYHGAGLGARRLRVRFRGDRFNSRSTSGTVRLLAFTESLASWYDDGGGTACGFHAGLGVANRTLPCGTKVTFRYGGRTVTAVVDDRGPFVGGREWDLNQNTAAALGFGGVGAVWTASG